MTKFEEITHRVPVEHMTGFLQAVEAYAIGNNVALEYVPHAPEVDPPEKELVRFGLTGSEEPVAFVDYEAALAFKKDDYTSALRTGSINKIFRYSPPSPKDSIIIYVDGEPRGGRCINATALPRFVHDLDRGTVPNGGIGARGIRFLKELSAEVQSQLEQKQ
jgi:hypothetical protein